MSAAGYGLVSAGAGPVFGRADGRIGADAAIGGDSAASNIGVKNW
jgi:hypothetical protein